VPALRLSLNGGGGWRLSVAYGIFLAVLLAGGVAIAHEAVFEILPLFRTEQLDFWAGSWLVWALVYRVFAVILPLWLILHAVRSGATLDGTVLTVRGLFRTRSADLAVARVRGETAPEYEGPISLVATMPGGGPEVRLRLGAADGLLPRPQLSALADAVAAGGTDDADRRVVVERLRLFVRRPAIPPRYLWADPPRLTGGWTRPGRSDG
jgi:hypothetical protein